VSIAASDIIVPKEYDTLVDEANEKVKQINNFFWKGFITADERYVHAIRVWAEVKNKVSKFMVDEFLKVPENDITYVIDSGARGNWGQVAQLGAMKGLVANPSGRTIELPSSLRTVDARVSPTPPSRPPKPGTSRAASSTPCRTSSSAKRTAEPRSRI
jgi:DNA-directed RNA polymerase beta' subunit